MGEEAETQKPHVLIVTGPQRERLYRKFTSLFDGRDDVQVVLDRRVVERRRVHCGSNDGERRRATDRRRRRPDWTVPPS